MRNLISILLSVLLGIPSFAQKDAKEYHIKITKSDGTVFEGYNQTKFTNYLRPYVTQMSVSSEFKGTPVTYTSDDIKRVEFISMAKDSIPKVFETVKVQSKLPNYFSKNPKPYKKPVFLRLIFDGKNIKGYAMPYTDHNFAQTPNMNFRTTNYTWRYFYFVNGSSVAKAYWDDTDGVIPNMKTVMKFYFREFPELVKKVDSGEITPQMFRDNPAMVLPIMDSTYKPESK